MRKGFALVSVLIMMVVLMSLLTAYFLLTRVELGTTQASARQTTGFYAAEAGLNLRAEEIRGKFLGYGRPAGTSPSPANPCQGSNLGSGDLACKTYSLSGRTVRTYVVEPPGNPQSVKIPPGELYENLEAQEYRYSLLSEALGPDGQTEAVLEMVFKSRLVPLFQFAVFYNKDLEILPGPDMTLNGRVHTNGDLYLSTGATLTIQGQVSTAGALYRGRKNDSSCSGSVNVFRADSTPRGLDCNGGSRRLFAQKDVVDWGGRIQVGVNPVTVPAPEDLDPDPSKTYFSKANLRLVLDLHSGSPVVKVLQASGFDDTLATTNLSRCSGSISGKAVGSTYSFYNNREKRFIRMLEVDLQALLDCLHNNLATRLDDFSNGGLIFHLSVLGPDSRGVNNYGVRIRNAARIAPTILGAPRPKGLTIVSDQAVYVQGDYNRNTDWIPSAILADSLNLLSNKWNDTSSSLSLSKRTAADTEVNAAFLAGTDTTGRTEGKGGQDQGEYNGGLENYPRLHEDWSNKTLTYRGSFVSLNQPRHVNGAWCGTGPSCNIYNPPVRLWSYDTRFSQGQLPPLSPRFVYLRQERFLRDFERP